jgi:hypothetical protein
MEQLLKKIRKIFFWQNDISHSRHPARVWIILVAGFVLVNTLLVLYHLWILPYSIADGVNIETEGQEKISTSSINLDEVELYIKELEQRSILFEHNLASSTPPVSFTEEEVE